MFVFLLFFKVMIVLFSFGNILKIVVFIVFYFYCLNMKIRKPTLFSYKKIYNISLLATEYSMNKVYIFNHNKF